MEFVPAKYKMRAESFFSGWLPMAEEAVQHLAIGLIDQPELGSSMRVTVSVSCTNT